MSDQRKAVVLLSGGMDSCVCAALARERHGAGNVSLAHVSYGQRTEKRERRAFEEIAEFYGVRERLAVRLDHFRVIGGSALTDRNIAVPEQALGAAGESAIPVTYVPFRNTHLFVRGGELGGSDRGGSGIYRSGGRGQFGIPGLPAGILPFVSGVGACGNAAGNPN